MSLSFESCHVYHLVYTEHVSINYPRLREIANLGSANSIYFRRVVPTPNTGLFRLYERRHCLEYYVRIDFQTSYSNTVPIHQMSYRDHRVYVISFLILVPFFVVFYVKTICIPVDHIFYNGFVVYYVCKFESLYTLCIVLVFYHEYKF